MARVTTERVQQTKQELLDAARLILMRDGLANLSTRAVAKAADTQMSQIQYHFGSKEGMLLALFDDMNMRLVERQRDTFQNSALSVSQKWLLACDYLEEDLASGYVQVLQELIAAGWSNPRIAEVAREGLGHWHELIANLAQEFEEQHGSFAPFSTKEIAALVSSAFIGAEAFILLGYEDKEHPVRTALRRVGEVMAQFEERDKKG
ncbi:MAG: TetR/AcrR family transcriptional regulator [Rhodobacteraceae bacterium]|uniref:TetR/AcrR family transcriptional regulator n=1 Tax=Marivita sp. TaxID=2003365 RepID=UPI003B51EF70|nr:TetR/AcrR family transcriptional regulator [Paracoccaceae bacterium]